MGRKSRAEGGAEIVGGEVLTREEIGQFAGELIGGKEVMKAGRAGWGTFLGGLAGVIAKLFIGLIMIVIFLMNVPSPL